MAVNGIILLHGWGTHCGVFARQLGFFKAAGYTVFTPDLYDLMPDESPGDFSIDAAVDAISKDVDESGVENIFVFGWSFGGIIAMKLAQKLAGKTKGIILCGFSPVFTKGDKNPFGMEVSAIDKLRQRIEFDASSAIEEFVKLVMHGYQYTSDFEMIKELILDEISSDTKDILLSSLTLLEQGDYTEDVKAIKAKTLIIHGTQDKLCKHEAVEKMSELIADCKVEIIENGSHIPFFTNADDFNRHACSFLRDSSLIS